ncbi:ABC transporter permease [Corynebacterium cystitidis]|nr:ABC transporter permease [Corynebacterium cystitidis]
MESIRLAATSLRANRMRSLLTLLGVIIGIASVIGIMTIGNALRAQTMEGLESFGAGDIPANVTLRSEEDEDADFSNFDAESHPESLITEEMIDQIGQSLGQDLQGYSVSAQGPREAELTDPTGVTEASSSSSIEGVNENSLSYAGTDIVAGRGIDATDVAGASQVAIISEEAVDKLFSGDTERALGSELQLSSSAFDTPVTVVGVYSASSGNEFLSFTDSVSRVYLPYTLVKDLGNLPEGFERVSFRPEADAPADPEADAPADTVRTQIQALFDSFYADDTYAHVKVSDVTSGLDRVNSVINNISLAISGIAAIALLVGGIGVMNIMLVSVTERTREIGIRKALGATGKAIKLQFVVEAMMVCLLGGVIGVLAGGLLGYAGSAAMKAPGLPPVSAVVIALVFSLGIGLFFGYYPAAKAAKLNPIEALRYE